uniref:Serine/threonine-protein phosphatase PGAM5, mitochondrial n=1 Tax=Strigamia maritima TaxID=126957 RepID=T1J2V7_STRMM
MTSQILYSNILTKTIAIVAFHQLHSCLFHVHACDTQESPYPYPIPPKSDRPWNPNWDEKHCSFSASSKVLGASGDAASGGECNQQSATKPKAKRNIFLIRHGQYHHKTGRLTKTGKEQATITGERLQAMGYPFRKKLISSTMIRALETASFIRRSNYQFEIKPIDSICEGAPFSTEPKFDHSPTDEQVEHDTERIEKSFCSLFYRASVEQMKDSYELVVCHSNVIRYFVCRALQFPPDAWMRFVLNNCSITWLVIHPDGHVELKAMGDAEHLPAPLVTNC